MRALLDLDCEAHLATFGAGVSGPDLEAQLRAHGYTLGHFPQSFEYSTLGGWIVTRSCGQQSLRYGRIEQLFAGGRLETPAGTLELPTFPASAAGTDLREMVLGSEGRLGILTEATVRITPLPAYEASTPCSSPTGSAPCAPCASWRRRGAAVDAAPVAIRSKPTMLTLAGHSAWSACSRTSSLRGCGAASACCCSASRGAKRAARAATGRRAGDRAPPRRRTRGPRHGRAVAARTASARLPAQHRLGSTAMPSTRWRPRSTGRA